MGDWSGAEERAKGQPRDPRSEDVLLLIVNHMEYMGYAASAAALRRRIGQRAPEDDASMLADDVAAEHAIVETAASRTLGIRKRVRALVMERRCLEALELVRASFPSLATHRGVEFTLMLQHFLDEVQAGRSHEAVAFSRTNLAPLARQNKEYMTAIIEVSVVIGYSTRDLPVQCPQLFHGGRRVTVAQRVCQYILETVSPMATSPLEQVVRQLAVVSQCKLVPFKAAPPTSPDQLVSINDLGAAAGAAAPFRTPWTMASSADSGPSSNPTGVPGRSTSSSSSSTSSFLDAMFS